MFEQARATATELSRQFSVDFPAALQEMTGRKSHDMYARALCSLKAKAIEAQKEHRFGIVARIVLARTFQAEMSKLTYGGGILRQATSELASALTFALA